MNNSIMFQEIQEEPAALRECIEQNQVMVKFLAEEDPEQKSKLPCAGRPGYKLQRG